MFNHCFSNGFHVVVIILLECFINVYLHGLFQVNVHIFLIDFG